MIVDSIAAGLSLIVFTILLGIIWNLSRKIDHLQHQVDEAHGLADFTLTALDAHLKGNEVRIEKLTPRLRETEKE